MPDDVLEYDSLVRGYEPRYGFRMATPKQARGWYLERPVLHYSIGTRVTPRVSKVLEDHGIKQVVAHADNAAVIPYPRTKSIIVLESAGPDRVWEDTDDNLESSE